MATVVFTENAEPLTLCVLAATRQQMCSKLICMCSPTERNEALGWISLKYSLINTFLQINEFELVTDMTYST